MLELMFSYLLKLKRKQDQTILMTDNLNERNLSYQKKLQKENYNKTK